MWMIRAGPKGSAKRNASSMLPPDSAHLFEVRDDRAQKARGLAAGHGAMVEGQRQRQQAGHRNPVICAHGALAGAADAEDRDLWWHDDEHGVLSADSSEIRQRERRTAQLGGLQAAVLDALLRSV